MIKYIGSIKEIDNYFEILNKYIYCIQNKTFRCINHSFEFIHSLDEGQSVSLAILGDKIITHHIKDCKSYVLDSENKLIKEFDFSINISPFQKQIIVTKDFFIPITVFSDRSKFRTKISLPQFSLEGMYPINYGLNGIFKLLEKSTFISLKEKYITCHDLDDGTELWRIDINQVLNIENAQIYLNRIINVTNRIFCFLHDENWNKCATICIDTETGKIISDNIPLGPSQYLHNGIIYTTSKYTIAALDPQSLELSKIDLYEILKKENLIIQNEFSFFYKNLLYFAAKPGEGNIRSCVGRINLDTKELEWWYEILKDKSQPISNDNRSQIQEIKANDKLICVLCAGGELYVFQIKE